MSSNNPFYPSVSELIDLDKVPNDLFSASNSFATAFQDIYYTDFQFKTSPSGDSSYYRLSAFFYNAVDFKIPGTSLKLILNPQLTPGVGNTSIIKTSLDVQWNLLRYTHLFNSVSIADTPYDIFNLIVASLNLNSEDFLAFSMSKIYGTLDPVNDFVQAFNTKYPANQLTAINDSNILTVVKDLISQTESIGNFNVFDYIYDEFINTDFTSVFDSLGEFFSELAGELDTSKVLETLTPKIDLSIEGIGVGLEFPNNLFHVLDPATYEPLLDAAGNKIPSVLTFNVGSLSISTTDGININEENSISFPLSGILNTGFSIGFSGAKFDFSKSKNIPEAIADNRPADFMGVYIQDGTIGFPAFWKHDDGKSTGVIRARNLLVGTGGMSGVLGLESKVEGLPSPLICAKFGEKFELCLNAFQLEFQQNSIIRSDIFGTLKIPGFKDAAGNDAEIDIQVFIGQNGAFSVTAKEDQGINAIEIPDILKICLNSVTVGRVEGKFYAEVSGNLDFADQRDNTNGGFIKDNLPKDIAIKKLRIWDDGKIEFVGGELVLRKPISLKLGPVNLSISAIDFGSYEGEHNGVLRQYNYFGFNGGIKVSPGGVEARGDGVKFFFTVDGGDLHIFVRVEGIHLNLVLPGTASPEDASLLLSGYISLRQPSDGNSSGGAEYSGKVDFQLPKLGFGGSAALKYNNELPSFLVDLEANFSQALPLGPSGLGLYGFRALAGLRYVASKSIAGVQPDEPWWKYYKAQVAPDYKEGVQASKFEATKGFSLGAGATIGTYNDQGYALGVKALLLISLPEVVLVQGQAQILKEIGGLETGEPPFFAILSVSRQSIEAALGVNYKLPDSGKKIGQIASVDGVIEAGYFFSDPSAWYLNLGRETPDNSRIQVYPLFNLFNAYFYFMLSSQGIRTGAGASFDFDKTWGPLSAKLNAYLDVAAKVSFDPKQFGGSIQLGGSVDIRIFKFGFNISASAVLAVEAPKPFMISGAFEACIKVLGKNRCAKFNFSWTFEKYLDKKENAILDHIHPENSAQAVNMQSKEPFKLNALVVDSFITLPPNPTSNNWPNSFDKHILPVDSFIDLSFSKGVLPTGDFGGNISGAKYTEFVPPQRGKSDRVRHEYLIPEINIYSWNKDAGKWEIYDVHNALTALTDASFIDESILDSLKDGYWQLFENRKYNALRLMSTSPLSLLSNTNAAVENYGINDSTIFCGDEQISRSCINYENVNRQLLPLKWKAGVVEYFEGQLFRISGSNTFIVNEPNGSYQNALLIKNNSELEILFEDSVTEVDVEIAGTTNQMFVEYYRREEIGVDVSQQPQYGYTKMHSETYAKPGGVIQSIRYQKEDAPIDRIVIKTGGCNGKGDLICDTRITQEGSDIEKFLNALAKNRDLLNKEFYLYPKEKYELYKDTYFNTSLFPHTLSERDIVTYTMQEYNIKIGALVFSTFSRATEDKCKYRLQTVRGEYLDYSTIVSFSNLRPDSTGAGENYRFLIDARLVRGNTVTLRGESCHNIISCTEECSSYLYQICFNTFENVLFNNTVPSTSQVEADVDALVNGLGGSIHPIWRPDTKYAVVVQTHDVLFRESSSSSIKDYKHTFFYGFQTEGPVGHYHKYQNDADVIVNHPDFEILEQQEKEDEYKLANLKNYVDYATSYPNANGNMLNAKPLFYGAPKLSMYYNYPYVYTMFSDWKTYNGAPPLSSSLELTIKDPVEPSEDPNNLGQPFPSPVTTATWKGIHKAPDLFESSVINNLAVNGDPCSQVDPIEPLQVSSDFILEPLKPLKQYTAIYKANYQRGTQPMVSREVHRYGFLTSRYKSFAEQVGSWKQQNAEGTVQRGFVFPIIRSFDPTQEIAMATTLLNNPSGLSDSLKQEFALDLDKLLQGIWGMEALQTPIGTEFNSIIDSQSGTVLGVLIRNPEPFNDPKLPVSIIENTISLEVNGVGNFKTLFSKDLSQMFVTMADGSLNMPLGSYDFTFRYKMYDGQSYIDEETIVVSIDDISSTPNSEVV